MENNRESERLLRESEARMRAVVNTAVDGILTIDERGTVESFNPAAERLFGYIANEVIGRNISMLMPEPYQSAHDGYLKNYMTTGEKKIIGIGREVEGQRKDGSTFPLEIAVSETRLTSGRVFTGIVRDISERKRLERELMEISARERHHIGQDLHDGLGQELTGISFRASSLREALEEYELPEAEDAGRIAMLLNRAIEHARALVKGLCPVSLGPEGLVLSMEDLANTLRHTFKKNCILECDPTFRLNDEAMTTQLYYIASEAVNNAIKHAQADQITIRMNTDGDAHLLDIEDNGVGFDPDKKASGRGILIMQYRANMIGASLEIQSKLHGGSRIRCRFRLPPTD